MGGHSGSIGCLHAISTLMNLILQQKLYGLIIAQTM